MNGAEPYYLDTSALLPYYREEAASPTVENFLLQLQPPVLISNLTKVEFASAVSRWVRRQEISEPQATLLEDLFWRDRQAGLFSLLHVTALHFSLAEKWLYQRKTSLRPLDALHLACCWDQKAVLATCDGQMHGSAKRLDLPTILIHIQP